MRNHPIARLINDDDLNGYSGLTFAVSIRLIHRMRTYIRELDEAWVKAADAAKIDTIKRKRKE